MSRARPPLQVNLRGAFDHATDLNDQLVIERRSRVLKQRRSRGLGGWGGSPGWPSRDGGRREGGSEDESEIIIVIIVSGDAPMQWKKKFISRFGM